jgi:hypothetical protein
LADPLVDPAVDVEVLLALPIVLPSRRHPVTLIAFASSLVRSVCVPPCAAAPTTQPAAMATATAVHLYDFIM